MNGRLTKQVTILRSSSLQNYQDKESISSLPESELTLSLALANRTLASMILRLKVFWCFRSLTTLGILTEALHTNCYCHGTVSNIN
jgi:hypothetical protein